MAEPRDSFVDDVTEEAVKVLLDGTGALMTTHNNCQPMSANPLTEYSSIYSTPPKESVLPVEDLLTMYESTDRTEGLEENGIFTYLQNHMACSSEQLESYSSSEEEILSNQDLTLDKDEIARDLLRNEGQDHETSLHDLIDTIDVKPNAIDVKPPVTSPPLSSERDGLVLTELSPSLSEQNEESEEAQEDNDGVSVGPNHQAIIPDLLSESTRSSVADTGERLLWNPSRLSEHEVETYCYEVERQNQQVLEDGANNRVNMDNSVKDDEQALYLLLQCGYNVEEAVRRRQCEVIPPIGVLNLWTQDECENFEVGLRLYGKNFHKIHQHKVRTRSVQELVRYYYTWKRTNRRKLKLLLHTSYTANVSTPEANISIMETPPIQTQEVAHTSPFSTHSPVYPELEPHMTDTNALVEPVHPLPWPLFRQPEVDFTPTARPNFDAVSISSALGPSVYNDTDCFGHPVTQSSLFTGHLYADGFPEAYCHTSLISSSQSADSNYPLTLTNDVCWDLSPVGPPPLKRFKSSPGDYQGFGVDGYPVDILLPPIPTAEPTEQNFILPIGGLPLGLRDCDASSSRSRVFPAANVSFAQWIGSPSLHS